MSETGAVKFRCEHVGVEAAEFAGFTQLNVYRRKLRELGLIGVGADGIGFGNVSIRDGDTRRHLINPRRAVAALCERRASVVMRAMVTDRRDSKSIYEIAFNAFYITGSGTGGKPELEAGDYARVTACDFGCNWLRCEGEVMASSESLTHAAVYAAAPQAGAVIHCHHLPLWSALIDNVPTTSRAVEYGTPGMAREVQRLFTSTDFRDAKLFVMGGHREGVVTFGHDIEEAFQVLRESERAAGSGAPFVK